MPNAMNLTGLAAASLLLLFLSCTGQSVDKLTDEEPAQVVGTAPATVGGTPSVVILESLEPHPSAPASDTLLMDQMHVTFTPAVVVARQGQVVRFRNSEEIPHNVRASAVESGATLFNVATDWREEHHHRFTDPGEYAIVCDIHPAMRATVLVVDTPYATVAQPDGSFAFSEVPPGTYLVRVWSADVALRSEVQVVVDGTAGQVILGPPAASPGP